jgi:hypothetical protein
LGFKKASHFCTAFKKYHRRTPAEYREFYPKWEVDRRQALKAAYQPSPVPEELLLPIWIQEEIQLTQRIRPLKLSAVCREWILNSNPKNPNLCERISS